MITPLDKLILSEYNNTMKKLNAKRRHTLTSSYNTMIQRCYNPNNEQYKDYGGRGIKVCSRWLPKQAEAKGFWNFTEDMGKRPSQRHSLDRIDNNKNYMPSNCKWSTPEEQARNRRNNILITYNGVTRVAKDWSKELNIPMSTIVWRYHNNLPVELILSPINYRGKKL